MLATPAPSPRLAVCTDPRFVAHAAPGFHPERPERLDAANRAVATLPEAPLQVTARAATWSELSAVHDAGYLERLVARLDATSAGFLDGDTYFSAGTRESAWLAAGSACAMVDVLLAGDATRAALLARPPGHHATRDRAMGFCLLNNVAIAAQFAASRGVARVAIVDWDVHHGNGTQDIFARRPDVLFVSLHESPLYPGTGSLDETGIDDGRGTTVNIPLPPGTNGAAYDRAFERIVLPALAAFDPQLLLVSAGFDAHVRDPLASMALEADDFGAMAWQLHRFAGDVPIGLVLEGGYDLLALEASLAATLRGLMGTAPASRTPSVVSPSAEHAVAAAERIHRRRAPPTR